MGGVLVACAGTPDFALTYGDAGADAILGGVSNGVACGTDLFAALARGAGGLPLADVLRTGVRNRAVCKARLIARTSDGQAIVRRMTFTPLDIRDTCAQTLVVLDDERGNSDAPVSFAPIIGVVAHELRSPLNAALMWISLLEVDRSPGAVERAIGFVKQSIAEQTHLIDDLLELADPLEHARRDVEQVMLPAVIEEALEVLRLGLPQSIDLRYAADDQPMRLVADAARIHQVIRHLVANAVRVMPNGGTIEMRLRRADGGHAVISVADQGGSHSLSDALWSFGGTADVTPHGLAIGVVQTIVARLGGSVCLCTSDSGNTFAISLPLSDA